MKAIVIDIVDGKAALLGEDGTVRKVADRGYQLGQKVTLEQLTAACRRKASVRFSHRLIAVACAAALLTGLGICAYAVPYGTVTQGDDASIEYTINVFDRVLDVRANNENGEAVLSEASDLKNMKIEEALDLTLAAGTTVSVETRSETHDRQLQEELDRSIRRTLEDKGSPGPTDAGRPDAEAGNPAAAENELPDAAPGAKRDQPAPGNAPDGGDTGSPDSSGDSGAVSEHPQNVSERAFPSSGLSAPEGNPAQPSASQDFGGASGFAPGPQGGPGPGGNAP